MAALENRRIKWLFAAYGAFVVYGSLIPFAYRAISLDEAFRRFSHIAYLNLDIGARADWVANILLYIPLSFLGCASVIGLRNPGAWRLLGGGLVLVFCLAVAVVLEFTQLFFAPRTVSLNDLLAEALGSIGGIILFWMGRQRLVSLLDAYGAGGRPSVVAVASLYALAYLALSFFPYDFLVDANELAGKLDSQAVAWVWVGECGGLLRCAARQLGEVAAIMPLGVLIAMAAGSLSLRRVFVVGAALGGVLEFGQILLASGVSQGLSLLWRGAGLALGYQVGLIFRRLGGVSLARAIRGALPYALPPYLLLLLTLGGVFSSAWLSRDEALARLEDLHLLPFYYHYYTTETAAMVSLLAQAGMYAPVGLAVWGWRRGLAGGQRVAAGLAFCLAVPVELVKLWLAVGHPDFTNALIAAASASTTLALLHWLTRVMAGDIVSAKPQNLEFTDGVSATVSCPVWVTTGPISPWARGIGCLAVLVMLYGWWRYPIGHGVLAVLLGMVGMALWFRPQAMFFLLPLLLPVLDLSSITGRAWLDEFDLIVLLTLAVGYWRFHGGQPRPWPSRMLVWAYGLLWSSFAIASLRGLPPWGELDGVLMDSSHSPLMVWQVGKGVLWALLLVPLVRRIPAEWVCQVRYLFVGGMAMAWLVVALVVLGERSAFVGLRDFDNVFRVTGTFASMNTGGAYLETFLASAFPVVLAWLLLRGGWSLVLVLPAAALASYALMVTFTRAAYVALAIGMVPVLWGTWYVRVSRRLGLASVGVVVVVATVATAVLSGGFAQSRLKSVQADFAVRLAHWQRALDLMDAGPSTSLLGMGFGQYPLQYLLRAASASPPGTFAILREGDDSFLSLGAGESVFLDQIVAIRPGERYTLSMRLRRAHEVPTVNVALCIKALLYSFECVGQVLQGKVSSPEWQTVSQSFTTERLQGAGEWWRPIKLSVQNPGAGAAIEVDDVSLKGEDGVERVANGSFTAGSARWLFVADEDLAWHIHQQILEVYFAQGVLGVLALTLLYGGTAWVLWGQMKSGDLLACGFLGALLAFFLVGLLGSNLDQARSSLLLLFMSFSAALLGPERR